MGNANHILAWGNDTASDLFFFWESVTQSHDVIYDLISSSWTGCLTVAVVCVVFTIIYFYLYRPLNIVYGCEDVGYKHLNGSRFKRNTRKQQLVVDNQKRRHLGNPPPPYPNGWFALLESSDLKTSQVKHVQALGENFAVMRSSTGEAHVLDAYCPHLGANMAVGGVVKGDCLECPFHGWQFRGEDGTCSHIPYSDKVPTAAKVRKWDSCEVNDWIFVWYHTEGAPPTWQVERVPEIEHGDFWLGGRSEFYASIHVQENHENSADFAHFQVVHGPGVFAGPDVWRNSMLWEWLICHSYNKLQWENNTDKGQEHMCTLTLKHQIKLMKTLSLIPETNFVVTMMGPGFLHINDGPALSIMTLTPIEPFHVRIIHRSYSRPIFTLYARLTHVLQSISIRRDMLIWNHKTYLPKPMLAKEEKSIIRFRQWYSQFYSSEHSKLPTQQYVLDW